MIFTRWSMRLRFGFLRIVGTAALLAALAGAGSVRSQGIDCEQLREQLATSAHGDPSRAAQFARAAQRQQMELERTQGYADQIGCDSGPFSAFGDSPPQCESIRAQIARMTNNLNALQREADALQQGDPSRQAALASQYQASCGAGGGNAVAGFDTDPGLANDEIMRPGLGDQQQDDTGFDQQGSDHLAGKAVCVRTCDGGYFPLSFSGEQHDAAGLQALCSALCPNTEAKLFTTPNTDDIGAATAVDGARYTDLPNAFKYQKTFSPTCTCKPANKSWVEALAEAEKLLGKSGSDDITVTAKMSDDMARPIANSPPQTKKKPSKSSRKSRLEAQIAAEAALGAVGAQAPTAGTESAGISADAGSTELMLKTDEGRVETVPGPDGAKRRVRIVAPKLENARSTAGGQPVPGPSRAP